MLTGVFPRLPAALPMELKLACLVVGPGPLPAIIPAEYDNVSGPYDTCHVPLDARARARALIASRRACFMAPCTGLHVALAVQQRPQQWQRACEPLHSQEPPPADR